MTNEWPIYAFDAALMAIVLGLCYLWYVRDKLEKATQREDRLEMMSDNYRECGVSPMN